MTDKEKNQIVGYRRQGIGYKEISKQMNLSINSIKSYCKRHGLGGAKDTGGSSDVCEFCGEPLIQTEGRKKKRFCSDHCRNSWWNKHPEMVNRKAMYEFICPHCGKPFTAYGNASRKYCSHSCYIADRFGGDLDE